MAFVAHDLSILAYANGFTLWHYATPDVASGVDTTGYFNAAADMLRVGDMILANADTDSTPAAGMLVVAGIADGAVTVASTASLKDEAA